MTDAAVATDIHQALDIELNHRTALALDLDAHLGNLRTNGAYLLIGPVLYFDVVADTCAVKNLAGSRTTDTVDIGQTDFALLVFGKSTPTIRAINLFLLK